MLSCHDVKKGDVLVCEECGLELKVIKECEEADTEEECCCETDESDCAFICCGVDMVKK